MSTKRKVEITDQQMSDIIAIIDKYRDDQGALIPVLHEVQDYFGYLPIEVQKVISDELHVPLAEIYGVVTFYARFSTQPKGKYAVSVCMGTACYVKGAGKILEKFENALGIKAGAKLLTTVCLASMHADASVHAVWLLLLQLTVKFTVSSFRLTSRLSATSI